MSRIQRTLIRVFAIAALLVVGAHAAHAQFQPNGSPYACTWKLANGATGVSIVTFTLGPGPGGISQGTVRNLYPDGSTLTKTIGFVPDIHLGGYYYYAMDNSVNCHVELYSSTREVVFTSCSTSVLQNCRQWM